MKPYIFITIMVVILLNACRDKNQDPSPETRLEIRLSHKAGNMPLLYDSLIYRNKTGELFSINKLHYYISDIRFYKNNRLAFAADTVVYIDAKAADHSLGIYNVPPFSYDSIAYYIGVPPAYNKHGMLAPTYENTAMQWPETMGGGYHFIMLEGHWQDINNTTPGYTIHLGRDPYLVTGGCKASSMVASGKEHIVQLEMDINEWFENPHVYSFQTDGTYTMNKAELMQKISENGRDVIRVKP